MKTLHRVVEIIVFSLVWAVLIWSIVTVWGTSSPGRYVQQSEPPTWDWAPVRG